ncbi:hypothetical protein CMUS01_08967 [Colletotrichum musicola]|uniref:Uncharacterized protein n=1 Tax=Colletotrichum musicola TaxID=2175873 RepID=A0A8H6K9Z3_9PEZI|nr:hypothetical protein CMUS01_08967 [Colletotrichum musicola]
MLSCPAQRPAQKMAGSRGQEPSVTVMLILAHEGLGSCVRLPPRGPISNLNGMFAVGSVPPGEQAHLQMTGRRRGGFPSERGCTPGASFSI